MFTSFPHPQKKHANQPWDCDAGESYPSSWWSLGRMLCSCGSSDITSFKTLGLDLSDDVFDCRKGRVSETRTDFFLGRGHKKSWKKKADFFFWGRRGRRTFLILVGTWIFFVCVFLGLYHGSHHHFSITNAWENWLSRMCCFPPWWSDQTALCRSGHTMLQWSKEVQPQRCFDWSPGHQ